MSRIISGRLKGRKLIAPKKIEVRPTTDRAKEALFNILRSQIDFEETQVLDLFAGIGNISIEFASRGCPSVTSVEINPPAVQFITEMVEKMNVPEVEVFRSEALRFLERSHTSYDLVFADPPYEYESYNTLVQLIFSRNLLRQNGLLVVEHGEESDLSFLPNFEESRRYGRVIFSFFRHPETE